MSLGPTGALTAKENGIPAAFAATERVSYGDGIANFSCIRVQLSRLHLQLIEKMTTIKFVFLIRTQSATAVMLTVFFACVAHCTFGQDVEWTNSGMGQWTDSTNWNSGVVPELTSDIARISNGGTATLSNSDLGESFELQVDGSHVRVNSGSSLNIDLAMELSGNSTLTLADQGSSIVVGERLTIGSQSSVTQTSGQISVFGFSGVELSGIYNLQGGGIDAFEFQLGGTVNQTGGQIFAQSGSIGGALNISSGSATFNLDGGFGLEGSVEVSGNGEFYLDGSEAMLRGQLSQNGGSFTSNAAIQLESGLMQITDGEHFGSMLTLTNGGTFDVGGNGFSTPTVNYDSIRLEQGSSFFASDGITSIGVLEIDNSVLRVDGNASVSIGNSSGFDGKIELGGGNLQVGTGGLALEAGGGILNIGSESQTTNLFLSQSTFGGTSIEFDIAGTSENQFDRFTLDSSWFDSGSGLYFSDFTVLDLSLIDGFASDIEIGDEFILFTNDSGFSISMDNTFASTVNPSVALGHGDLLVSNGIQYEISFTSGAQGQSIGLTVVSTVPEPTANLLLGAFGLIFLRRQRA
jgi:hypothetical protein